MPFGKITTLQKKCRTDWSLKIFGRIGALDSERWEHPIFLIARFLFLADFHVQITVARGADIRPGILGFQGLSVQAPVIGKARVI